MAESFNHTCSICGAGYNACSGCMEVKSYAPWRTIVDNVEHYRIFMVLRDYNNQSIDKCLAREQLMKCNLAGLDGFIPEVKNVIYEILPYEDGNVMEKVTSEKQIK
ncbi:hypothetical protein [Anaerocolumna jejuensis]|uniref:hypothetical protein n=1 Tax=Anaerocolumna jejuensis TaxID=259063 RepID=UPI003F7C5C40